MRRPAMHGPLPPVLFTRAAVRSFAELRGLARGQAAWLLTRAAQRVRVLVEPVRPVHGLGALAVEGLDVVLLVRRLPELAPWVCVRVARAIDEAA